MPTTTGITVPVTAELSTGDADAVRAVADLTRTATEPTEIRPGIWAAVSPLGEIHELDLRDEIERRQPNPDRKKGTYAFTEPASLVGYLAKHSRDETELYANVDRGTITAVINAHSDDGADDPAGWGDHRATLTLRKTDDWNNWIERDGKWLTQTGFAEFIEQHLPCCVTPDGATMLELAQSIKGTKAVTFEQSKRLKSGETKLEYREDVEAKAGARGSIDIPDEITLALTPFEHGEPYKVTARLRYRIDGATGGNLALSYVLLRPRDILLNAFGDVVGGVAKDTGRDIWHGTSG